MDLKLHNPGYRTPGTPPISDRMQRGSPACSPANSLLVNGENQIDFFRKLGYSAAQVRAVMNKFGADTDRVLGELVRTGASPEAHEEETALTRTSSPSSSSCVSEPGTRRGSSRDPEGPEFQEEGVESLAEALRPIVIDGSNVAMSHGNKEVFSCLGIQLAVNFFLERGHSDIIVFVPSWRKEPSRPDVPISDQHILRDLEKKKIVVFTPSRRVAGKRVVCYDDRFIVKLAHQSTGIVVSNDTYRDLQGENPEWRRFIEQSLLMYFFVNDKFIVPDDPLGRHGPTLDNFLRKVPKMAKKHPCPYGRKCTYGIKCKFLHPDRGPQSNLALADELRERAKSPSSHHGPGSLSSGGSLASGSSQCLSLEEEMAQKLSLHHQPSSASRKGPVSENVVVNGGAPSGRRQPARKEKACPPPPGDREPLRSTGSQVQLDSGLGSIENQSTDVSWEHGGWRYGEGYGLSHPVLSQEPLYYPANMRPCSCCSHPPPSQANPATPHHHPHHHQPHRPFQNHSTGPPAGAHTPDPMAYGPPRYLGYGGTPYPRSMHAHSQSTDLQNRMAFQPAEADYWSDPYSPAGPYTLPGERPAPWGYHQPPAPPSPPGGGRETVRKKLLAIFNSRLVDQAMEMYPHVLDPQVLVAEIIMLQGQDRARR
ncbi:unnamed protein product [Gadus morhua 'NCC']